MTPQDTRFLHVANGTATTALIAAAAIPGARSIWADPLHEGPVPAGLSDAALIELRARFLAPDPPAPLDPVNDLRLWRTAIANHHAYDELVLWYEHDLFDQLNLIQLLAWIPDHVPAAKRVTLICPGAFPGRPHFKGLGELAPSDLSALFPTRQPVAEPHYALAARAWEAFRAPTPEPLDALCHDDSAALPYLRRALTRFLQEYPWAGDGLTRSERRLLQLLDHGAGPHLGTLFPRMHDTEDAYYITDASLCALVADLSATSPPLVSTAPIGDGPLDRHVALTAAGRAVLRGQTDRLTLGGVDRWLGGVHLREGMPSWRWDESRQAAVPAA